MARSDFLPFTLPRGVRYRHFKVVYRFNAMGYRGLHPRRRDKFPGTRRLLFCGDSFTLGWGVDEPHTFVARIERRLNADRRGTVEAINAGYHAGYSPDSYLTYWKYEGAFLDPDEVFFVLYSGNDMGDVSHNVWLDVDAEGVPRAIRTIRNWKDYRGHYVKTVEELLPWYLQVPVLKHSRVFVGVGDLVGDLARRFDAKYGNESAARTEARFARALDGARRFGDATKVPVRVVVIPDQDVGESWPRAVEFTRLHAQVVSLVRAAGLELCDLAGALSREDYFRVDRHLNPTGHERVAKAVIDRWYGPGSDGAPGCGQ